MILDARSGRRRSPISPAGGHIWRMLWLAAASASCAAAHDDSVPNAAEHGDGGAPGAGGGGAVGGAGDLTGSPSATGSTTSSGGGSPCANPEGAGGAEVCGDGVDQNGDGFVDEGCTCDPGAAQTCYLGAGSLCDCKLGTQQCVVTQEFGQWGPCVAAEVGCAAELDQSCEVCGNGSDDDCDGAVDEQCVIELTVDIDGDCVTASCPPQAPYPIGCNITMAGSDPNGCVANSQGSSGVYFQEGDKCGVGHVSGSLTCSSLPGPALDASNCALNKSNKLYPADPAGCPEPD
jgi:hypothetical protein